ncbi:MAG TPA: ABC transporter permease [Mycobacteriales bacterium]|nr:ABC transporter permease [Mycobacteriales bacterium]
MNVVLAWARLDMRRRWRAFVVLVVLVAFSGTVILATLVGARRTDTVLRRLLAGGTSADVMVLPNMPGFDWTKVRTLPSVKALGLFSLTEGPNPTLVSVRHPQRALSADNNMTFAPADAVEYRDVDRPKLVSGRYPDPTRADEALASVGFRKRYGDLVRFTFPSAAQVKASSVIQESSDERNEGRVVDVHIVGEAVGSFGPTGGEALQVLPTYAFYKDVSLTTYPYHFENARIILKGGIANIAAFRTELGAVTGNHNIDVVDWRAQVRPTAHATTFTATGWLLFAIAALVASIVLIGQALVRFCAGATDDMRTLGSLGLDPRQARRATMALPLVAALIGVVLAVGGAIAVSGRFPTGVGAQFEPSPGIQVDVALLSAGAGVLVVLAALGTRIAAGRATRNVDLSRDRRSMVASAATRAGLGPTAVLGTRFALEPGRGRSRVPVRPALVGAVAGVLGVVGALTFRTGLDAAADNPLRFGQTMDYGSFVAANGAPTPDQVKGIDAAGHDPAVAFLDDLRVDVFPINARPVSTFSLLPVGPGAVRTVSLHGRAPTASDEVALGPTTAKDLHVHVGDVVTVGTRPMHVSGITFVPEDSHNGYADGAWLTGEGFSLVQPDLDKDKFHEVRLALKPGTDVHAALARLTNDLGEVDRAADFSPIEEQQNLKSVRVQPLLLGGFLLLLALGAVGHALAASVRRRRHDVAVLRALGMTRWQSRLTVAVQATVLAAVGLAFGIPLGIAAGRSSWRALADATPIIYVPPLAAVAVLLSVPVAVAVANALAALPARRAARLEVGRILRAE